MRLRFEKANTVMRVGSYVIDLQRALDAMLASSLLFGLLILSSCADPRNGYSYTNVSPRLDPLEGETLQATQPDSTAVLSRADKWLRSSELLLSSVTDSSSSSGSSSQPTDD